MAPIWELWLPSHSIFLEFFPRLPASVRVVFFLSFTSYSDHLSFTRQCPYRTYFLFSCLHEWRRTAHLSRLPAAYFSAGLVGRMRRSRNEVVGFQQYAPAVFTPRGILVLIFRGWVDPGHMELSDATEIIPSDTTGDRFWDLSTSSAVT
jgi:hypothetical protein